MPRSSTVSLIARQGDNLIISMSALKVLGSNALIALIEALVNAPEQTPTKRAYTRKSTSEQIAEMNEKSEE